MKDLVSLYKTGKLKGPIEEKDLISIWETIKTESPNLIKFLNSLKTGQQFSEKELIENKEKIEIYSKLVDRLCKFNLRKEVPYFDQEINHFCESVKRQLKNEDLAFQTLALTNEYALIKDHAVVFKTNGISLFDILCRVLVKKEDDQEVFLYYLSLMAQDGSVEALKKFWTMNLYIVSKKA